MTSEHRSYALGVPVTSPFCVAISGKFVNLQMFYYFPPEHSPFFLKKLYHLFFKRGRMYYLCYVTDVPPMSWGNESIMILADFVGETNPFNPTLFMVPLNMRFIYVQRWATSDLHEFCEDNKNADGKIVNYIEFVNRSRAMGGMTFLLDRFLEILRASIPDAVVSEQMRELSDIFEEAQKSKSFTEITQVEVDSVGEISGNNGVEGADGQGAVSDNASKSLPEQGAPDAKEARKNQSA
jgi:hypothetical protein